MTATAAFRNGDDDLSISRVKCVIAFVLVAGLAALTWYLGYQGVTPDVVGLLVIGGILVILGLLAGAYFLAKADMNIAAVICAFLIGIIATGLAVVLNPKIGVGGTAALLGAIAITAAVTALAGICRHEEV